MPSTNPDIDLFNWLGLEDSLSDQVESRSDNLSPPSWLAPRIIDGVTTITNNIISVNTRELWDSQLMKISELIQDVWSDGTGEFLICNSCEYVHSKKDIFGLLPSIEYEQTVSQLLKQNINIPTSCIKCSSETTELYASNNIAYLREKYNTAILSFLILLKDKKWNHAWFAEGYVDTFDKIYSNEFDRYFQKIGIDAIWNRITNILWNMPQYMVVISGLGIRNIPEFRGFRMMNNAFLLLSNLFRNLGDIHLAHPWIMLLDKNHVMHHIFSVRVHGPANHAKQIYSD